MTVADDRIDALCDRVVRRAFAAEPYLARMNGEHGYDGVLGPVGDDAVRQRVAELDALGDALAAASLEGASRDRCADRHTALLSVASDRFRLGELRFAATRPDVTLDLGADVLTYVARPYAPAPDRAEALCRHLEELPDWLDACAATLDPELAAGPRAIAVDAARGHASFYRDELRRPLGELEAALRRRLDAAVEGAARACEEFAARVEAIPATAETALGAARFCALLEAQEGVSETADQLARRADAELDRLAGELAEVAAEVVPGGDVAEAFRRMEASRPIAAELIPVTAAMLDRLRDFWIDNGVVGVPRDVRCRVQPTPAFRRWSSASYENPGPLEPPDMPHTYFVTTVQPDWTAEQADEWLRYLNHASLENISVHEAFPGHFIHAVHGLQQRSLVRRVFWFSGFGEGWAHYTEQLAVEHGLADGRPLLHLAQVQDAVLRACRFRSAVGIHCEGMTVEESTRLFMERAHMPRLPAEREALRGTHDPLYLVYTYGKLEILSWRETLRRRPGFDLRVFHDTLLDAGFPPLAVQRDIALGLFGG